MQADGSMKNLTTGRTTAPATVKAAQTPVQTQQAPRTVQKPAQAAPIATPRPTNTNLGRSDTGNQLQARFTKPSGTHPNAQTGLPVTSALGQGDTPVRRFAQTGTERLAGTQQSASTANPLGVGVIPDNQGKPVYGTTAVTGKSDIRLPASQKNINYNQIDQIKAKLAGKQYSFDTRG